MVFGEDFYELIEEDGAKPAQQEETETEKTTEKSEEKQALTRSDWGEDPRLFKNKNREIELKRKNKTKTENRTEV